MKQKLLISAAVCLCLIVSSFELQAMNLQKVYPVDSEIYQGIEHLYIQQGLALPSSSGPWSGDELLQKLMRLDYASLNEHQQASFDALKEMLAGLPEGHETRTASVRFGLELAAEGYYQTNTDDFFTNEQRWAYSYPDRSPLLNVPMEVWATDSFYGYFELPLMNARHRNYFDQSFTTNLIFDETGTDDILNGPNIALHFPVRGFVSAGGENWSVQFGRDTLKWGDGISGNLIIGEHLDYHEFIRFTTYHDRFKFTTLASSFVHPAWYYDTADDYLDPEEYTHKTGSMNAPRKGFRALIAHRLEFRPWDALKISVSETMMYMDESLDFRFLNPGMFYHNYYMRSNSKSMVGLELDYSPVDHINLYVNAVVDETGLLDHPRAYGILSGIKASYPVGSGSMFFRLEGAYTDPYLYLRDGTSRSDPDSFQEFPVDHIVSLWQWGENFPTGSGLYEVRRFLGYEYGNDAVAFQAEGGYHVFDQWKVQGSLLYLLEGTHDMYTVWDSDGHEEWAPTDFHPDHPDRDAVQHTLLIELMSKISPLSFLDLFGHAASRHVWNIGNKSDGGYGSDLQVSFGASFTL